MNFTRVQLGTCTILENGQPRRAARLTQVVGGAKR